MSLQIYSCLFVLSLEMTIFKFSLSSQIWITGTIISTWNHSWWSVENYKLQTCMYPVLSDDAILYRCNFSMFLRYTQLWDGELKTTCIIRIFRIIYSGPCSITHKYTHFQHEMHHTVHTQEESSLSYRMINVFYNNVLNLLIIGLAHSSISLGRNNHLWWLGLETYKANNTMTPKLDISVLLLNCSK